MVDITQDEYNELKRAAYLWNKYKDQFIILHKMLDIASPLILNKLKVEDAVKHALNDK